MYGDDAYAEDARRRYMYDAADVAFAECVEGNPYFKVVVAYTETSYCV